MPVADLKDLAAEIDSLGISRAELCAELGINKSTLSLILSGKYTEKRSMEVAAGIEAYIERVKEQRSAVNIAAAGFVVRGQQRVLKLTEQLYDKPRLAILTGQSGSGKSYVAKLIAKKPHTLYVRMRKNLTVSGIIDLLSTALTGHAAESGNKNKRFDKLVRDLNARNIRVIEVDEVDMFAEDNKRTFVNKFEVFRDLYECGFSVLCLGLDRLADKLHNIGEEYINRRVKLTYTLSVKREDLSGFYDYLGLPDCPEKESIIDRAYNNGNFGIIENIAEQYALFEDIRLANELVFATRGI